MRVCVCLRQVWERGGYGRRAPLLAQVGVPPLRGHLLDQDEQGPLAQVHAAPRPARLPPTYQGGRRALTLGVVVSGWRQMYGIYKGWLELGAW